MVALYGKRFEESTSRDYNGLDASFDDFKESHVVDPILLECSANRLFRVCCQTMYNRWCSDSWCRTCDSLHGVASEKHTMGVHIDGGFKSPLHWSLYQSVINWHISQIISISTHSIMPPCKVTSSKKPVCSKSHMSVAATSNPLCTPLP